MPVPFLAILPVAIAGGFGCMARVAARDALAARGVPAFGTICAVNLVGAAAIGWIAGAGDPIGPALAIGFLGGWTTYSAFALDVAVLWRRGERRRAFAIWSLTALGAPVAAGVAAWIR